MSNRQEPISPREKLMMADSIMEPDVLITIQKYLQDSSPEEIIQMLSANYKGFPQMINLIREWRTSVLGESPDIFDSMIKNHLSSLIKQNFDPHVVDKIFLEVNSRPLWIDEMIKTPEWQTLLYELSRKHTSRLLTYSTTRISQLNLQKSNKSELANITSSTVFSVFINSFTDLLLEILKLTSETSVKNNQTDEQFNKLLSALKHLCCEDQNTFVCSLAILNNLIEEPDGKPLKRIIQELVNEVKDKDRTIWKMILGTSSISKYPVVYRSIFNTLTGNHTTPGDVIKLYNLYRKADHPPLDFLRIPQFIEALIRDLFDHTSTINDRIEERVYLLAISILITLVRSICKNQLSIISYSDQELSKMKEAIRFPIASVGILKWIKGALSNKTYTLSLVIILAQLQFINEIICRHPCQHPEVFEILRQLLFLSIDVDISDSFKIKKLVVDSMIELMKAGYVIPIIKFFESSSLDRALLRYFVNQLLEIIEPPFSNVFFEEFSVFLRKIISIEANSIKQKLIPFLQICLESPDTPQEQKNEFQEIFKEFENISSQIKK
ncbi:negative elongation factor d [Anaeramoeba ignava]|uniref:Negative elongation factor d n=1 Tax=Anaeramoeba ignava TaxID=1746090 RepID=A0A9Q0LG71_ANAIG|nr:negative elongation factor d [Anaeramoeba ignava]